jgi:hypothetical protein
MKSIDEFNRRFDEVTFSLSKEDILDFDKDDNGTINNVMVGIHKHCLGVRVWEEEDKIGVNMYYVNNDEKLCGDLIELYIDDKDYFKLLLQFCNMLSQKYEDLDATSSFNVLQDKLRGFLEKMGFFTVTDLELMKYKGSDLAFIHLGMRGIKWVRMIDRIDFYRTYFDDSFKIDTTEVSDYVYLMVNNETGLIKIGTSKKPKYREGTLHSKEPSIAIIALWKCDRRVEKELHQLFCPKRSRGEWFSLDLTDLREIGLIYERIC